MNALQSPRDVVLIVDDTPANLAYLSDALDEAGFKVLVAIDGQTALERLQLVTPDVILLDAMMPGMDGFETCRSIKNTPAIADIPVIFMTGLVDTPHVVRAFEEGAIDYVTKPVCQEEVLARINTHIQCARRLDKAHKSIEACGKAGLTVGMDGNVSWQTPRVRQWLGTDLSAKTLTDNLGLTAREAEVLSWLAGGKTNRDIAQILGVSPRTVNKHLEHVYIKLGVETRGAAVAVAVQTIAAPSRGSVAL